MKHSNDNTLNKNSTNQQSVSFNLDNYNSSDTLSNVVQNNSILIDSCIRSEDVNFQKLERDVITNRSHRRKKKWVDDNVEDMDQVIALNEGAIDVDKHAVNHSFRDRIKDKEMTQEGFFNRTFETSKERAITIEKEHDKLYLKSEPFKNKVQDKDLLRKRNMEKQISVDMRYKDILDNERISQGIKDHSKFDSKPLNMKTFHFPTFRQTQPNKWTTKRGFSNHTSYLGGKDVWEQRPIEKNVYIDGFENTGKTDIHQRTQSLDLYPNNEFTSYTRKDIWDSTQHVSQSIRTGMNDKVLKMQPVKNNFDESKHSDHYNQSLVDTKNVNHMLPFKHSNNIKGEVFNNLRPMNKRIYPKTTHKQMRVAYRNYKDELKQNYSVDKSYLHNNGKSLDLNFQNLIKLKPTKGNKINNIGLSRNPQIRVVTNQSQITAENQPTEENHKANYNDSLVDLDNDFNKTSNTYDERNVRSNRRSIFAPNKRAKSKEGNFLQNVWTAVGGQIINKDTFKQTENHVIDSTLNHYFS